MISLHAEVSHREDILELHEEIDVIERDLMDRFQCMATIHMDPIVTDDVDVIQAKDDVKAILKSMDDRWKFHDFRMVKGKKSSNVIFDVVIPMEQMKEKDEIEEQIRKNIHEKHPKYNAVVTVEQSYV